jgi:8-oxo-dGTP diphosphatase
VKTKNNFSQDTKITQSNGDLLAKKLIQTAQKDGIKKLSVGAAIFHDGKILILQRKPDDFMPNIYELPGGGLESGESLFECLKREIREETNCTIKQIIGYIGYIDFLSSTGLPTRRFNFLVQPELPLIVELSEHQSYQWIFPTDARNYDITPQTQKIIESLNHTLTSKID